MNGNIISQVHDLNSVKAGPSIILKDGSSVLVRVIADKGNGKYEGSVAGVRTLFSAKNVLSPGTSFPATVSFKDGKILIVPKDHTNQIIQNKIDVISFLENNFSDNVFEIVDNKNIASFISQFNLPTDKLSLHLILQFKQLDMKFDSALMNKIRNSALKFPGKEKKVMEFLSLMSKKGISLDEKEIKDLLEELDFSIEEKEVFIDEKEQNLKKDFSFKEILAEYIRILLSGVNQENIGILTVFNQCYQKSEMNQEKKWLFLPFEIVSEASESEIRNVEGKGNFKLFLHDKINLKFLNIECNFRNKSFLFNMEFDKNKLRTVKFNISSGQKEYDDFFEIDELKSELRQKLEIQKISVDCIEWADANLLKGTSCENEELFLFSGEI